MNALKGEANGKRGREMIQNIAKSIVYIQFCVILPGNPIWVMSLSIKGKLAAVLKSPFSV